MSRTGATLVATPGKATVDQVMLYFSFRDATQRGGVQIQEVGHSYQVSFPSNATPTTLTIGGHEVRRIVFTNGGGTTADFRWADHGTTVDLSALIVSPLTKQDMEHMVASMLQPGGAAATPTP